MPAVCFQYSSRFCAEVRMLSPGVFCLVAVRPLQLSTIQRLRTGIILHVEAGALVLVSSPPLRHAAIATEVLPSGAGHLYLTCVGPPCFVASGQQLALLTVVGVVGCGLALHPPAFMTSAVLGQEPSCEPAAGGGGFTVTNYARDVHRLLHMEITINYVGETEVTEEMVREMEQFVRNYVMLESVFYSSDFDVRCPSSCLFLNVHVSRLEKAMCVRVSLASHSLLGCDINHMLSDFVDVLRLQGSRYGACVCDAMHFVQP
ncbi:E4 ORFD [Murine mastadenovirus A]|uniref:E4 ORFD n=1 Tax=Murine mastadenovirus A TaxID=129956 RepID=UPI00001D96CB|nr:E4 ORFD [Murine mastadenovirus A]